MKMRKCWLVIWSLMLVGCSLRPSGVLSSSKMADVLADVHYAEAVVRQSNISYGHEYEQNICFQSVLDRHHITQAQFDSSLVWYTDNPLIFNRVYPRVIAKLEKQRQHYEAMLMALSGEQRTIQLEVLPMYEEMLERTFQPAQGFHFTPVEVPNSQKDDILLQFLLK